MKNGVVDLDHLMVSVADAGAAGAAFERLGFTATPRSRMMGCSNRLVCFPSANPLTGNFIELLGVDEPAAAPAFMRELLGAPGRPVSMVMATADAREAEIELRRNGFGPMPPLDVERRWEVAGERLRVAFSVVLPRRGVSPLYWNLCQHRTREHYVRPDFTAHRNGARALKAVLAVTDDPSALAAHYAEAWGAPREGATVRPGAVELRALSPAEFAAAYPGAPALRGLAGCVLAGADLGRPWLVLDEIPGCLIAGEP